MLEKRIVSNQDGLWARTANLILAGWLFLSAFAWGHYPAERVSTAYVGLLVFVSALCAVSVPRARNATSVLALWLFISPLLLPTQHAGTAWNNTIVAVLMFVLSLVEPHRQGAPSGWPRRAAGEGQGLAERAA